MVSAFCEIGGVQISANSNISALFVTVSNGTETSIVCFIEIIHAGFANTSPDGTGIS